VAQVSDETPLAPLAPAPTRERLDGWFRVAAFVVLAAVGALATVQAYLSLQSSIALWLQPQWVSVGQGAFSLVILGVVVWLLRAFVLSRRP
jgi:hypothetical protein